MGNKVIEKERPRLDGSDGLDRRAHEGALDEQVARGAATWPRQLRLGLLVGAQPGKHDRLFTTLASSWKLPRMIRRRFNRNNGERRNAQPALQGGFRVVGDRRGIPAPRAERRRSCVSHRCSLQATGEPLIDVSNPTTLATRWQLPDAPRGDVPSTSDHLSATLGAWTSGGCHGVV